MAGGLVALLDDVAALTKLAAASLDDVTGAAARAGVKAAGVVVDDTAVTPRYVAGLAPARELPIIGRIALGSLRNKVLILLPVALGLEALAPWAITPLLMLGGAYLCFEGAEKVVEALRGHHAGDAVTETGTPAEIEDRKVRSAVRTDFILSAEIMVMALAEVTDKSFAVQAVALAAVALGITAGVYGVVAVIVKVDDVGVYLARRPVAVLRALGRGLVRGMPVVMRGLTVVGTAAMLWVGGGILLHGLEGYGVTALGHGLHGLATRASAALPALEAAIAWLVTATGSGLLGLVVGGVLAAAAHGLRPAEAAA
ncbi:DUF808 domain-containing protein [Lichenihabitans sp. Uapishka_5]|uniref:DUF808 domain-containing protein n=1 Tax=Lichenihabitans sp. Uapishka_5 TaxID=3037302 RepID=UPI0029E80C5E|nr:DUF808 domain-containing protein [Lichenihabitans sp. Uapishka_5]MDX7953268.1 DUF808 domain-containing protein [Lichenihabitans sp. Uapishka_5]